MSKKKQEVIWSVVIFGVMMVLVVTQFLTGASEFNSSMISTLISVVLAVGLARFIKKRRQETIVKDERYTEIARKTNNTVFAYGLFFEIFGYGLAWALSPYWPELKIVAITLLTLAILQSVAARVIFWFWERKNS